MADGISIGNDLNRFKVIDLKEWLKIKEVKTSGKKQAHLIFEGMSGYVCA